MKRKYISVSKETMEFICKAFGCTRRMVEYALSFDEKNGNSDKAKKIRTLALKRDGIVMLNVPECETMYDTPGIIEQVFPNGARLLMSKIDGSGQVVFKGEVKKRYDGVIALDGIDAIQQYAASLR